MNPFESVPLMTAIDLFVVVTAIAAVWAVRRSRSGLQGLGLVGPATVVAGLGVIAGFYAADLVTMWLLPPVVGEETATAVMDDLHLKWSWGVVPAAALTVAAGVVLTLNALSRAERQLARTADLYRSVVRTQRELIHRWRPDGQRTFVNEAYCRYLGRPQEELLGGDRLEELDEESRERLMERVAALTPEDHSFSEELEVVRTDGSRGWLEWSHHAVFDPSGELLELQSAGRDVTERRRVEAEIRDLNESLEQRVSQRTRQLEDANRELESFAYSISHDLRAPLRSISGFCEIIRDRYEKDLNEEAERYFGYILRSSEHMEQLIDDLLLYSRLGRKAHGMAAVDLDEVFQKLIEDLNERLEESDAKLIVPTALPQVHGHRSLLGEVFRSLIDNALAYRHPDRPPEIEVDSRTETSKVLVSVSDNGAGIAPEFHSKIFEIFQRLHRYDVVPGTGVGLAMVRKAVNMMGGRVWVESTVGEGSTFFLELLAPSAGAAQ